MREKIAEAVKVILWLLLFLFVFGWLLNATAHANTFKENTMYALPCTPNCPPALIHVVKSHKRRAPGGCIDGRTGTVETPSPCAIGYGGTTGRYTLAPIGSS